MILALLSLGLSFARPVAAADPEWGQWRGPLRNGVVTAPLALPASLPAPAWKTKVGPGYSSPVIGEGRVFLLGKDTEATEVVYCLDAKSGKEIWSRVYPVTYRPLDPTSGNWPKSTPTLDGDRVYTLGLGGMFLCLDSKSGREIWKHDFSQFWGDERNEAGDNPWFPVCGMAASALVDGDQVIVPVGGKKVGALAAFHRESGKLLWHALPERSSYASPLKVELGGVKQIIGFTGKRLAGIDPATQELLWEVPFPAHFEQTIITPVTYKDMVIVSGEQRPTVGLRIGREAGKVTKTQVWQNPDLKAYMTCPVIVGDYLYGFDSLSRRLVCVSLADGTTKWTGERTGGHITLLAAADRILVQSSRGEMTLVKADPEKYAEAGKWKLSDDGQTWACPGIANGRLYIKDKDHLLCFDLSAATTAGGGKPGSTR